MESLKKLDFTDLYVCLSDSDEVSRYNPRSRAGQRARSAIVPQEYREAIDSLVAQVQKEPRLDFSLDFDDMRMRGVRLTAFSNNEWVVLRRFPSEVPNLEELNFSSDVLRAFRSWSKREGLIVVGGSTRAGKTTTACAILRDYLITNGQMAITIEDPIEFYLQGPHGEDGFCLQMPVYNDGEWSDKLKSALRAGPRYIFIGEVRTAMAAATLLRAANSGHLVFCTVHGGAPEVTLSAIVQIALPVLGDMAITLLADSLVAVVHQRIEAGRPVNLILSTQDDPSDPIRTIIRAGKLNTLSTEIHNQGIHRRKFDEVSTRREKQALSDARDAAPKPSGQMVAVRPKVVSAREPEKKGFMRWLFG